MRGIERINEALALLPTWEPNYLSRSQVVESAQRFVGLPYDEKRTFVERNEAGQLRGHCNCYGLLFLVCIDLGLIDAKPFWRAWNRAISIVGQAAALRHYLAREMTLIDVGDMAPGDALLFRWKDATSGVFETEEGAMLGAKHHLAILTKSMPDGKVIQATDTTAHSGAVFETDLMARDESQLHRVATFKQFQEVNSNF